MPYCMQCGSHMPEEANFCRQCGFRGEPQEHPQQTSPENPAESMPTDPQQDTKSSSPVKTMLKRTGIGCLVIIGVGFAIAMVIGIVTSSGNSSAELPEPLVPDSSLPPGTTVQPTSEASRPKPEPLSPWLPDIAIFLDPGDSSANRANIGTAVQTSIQPIPAAETDNGPTQQQDPDAALLKELGSSMDVDWAKDGITSLESEILDNLNQLIQYTNFTAGGTTVASLVQDRLPGMAFLQTPESGDITALKAMRQMPHYNINELELLLDSPWLGDQGITDAQIPHVSAISALTSMGQVNTVETILAPEQTTLQSVEVLLPHSGPVSLNVLQQGETGHPEALKILQEAALAVETFMGAPMNEPVITVLFIHGNSPGVAASTRGDIIIVTPGDKDNRQDIARTLTHEIAHIYWTDNEVWLDEGMAEFIGQFHLWSLGAEGLHPRRYPCRRADNISQLKPLDGTHDPEVVTCHYILGERLMHHLYQKMGEMPFRNAARTLYTMAIQLDTPVGIQELGNTFQEPDVINTWYTHLNPRIETGQDRREPTWRLPQMRGEINSIYLALEDPDIPLESFSASSQKTEPYLVAKVEISRVDGQKDLPLILVEQHEDGFIYEEWEFTLDVGPELGTWTWSFGTGPDKHQGWKPGAHRAMIYSKDGTKLAETRWQVNP